MQYFLSIFISRPHKTTPRPPRWEEADRPKSYSTFSFHMGEHPSKEEEEVENKGGGHVRVAQRGKEMNYVSANEFRRPKDVKGGKEKQQKAKAKAKTKKRKKVTWIKNKFGFTDATLDIESETRVSPSEKKRRKELKFEEEEEAVNGNEVRRRRRNRRPSSTAVTVSTVRRPTRVNYRSPGGWRTTTLSERLSTFTRPIRKEDTEDTEEESEEEKAHRT